MKPVFRHRRVQAAACWIAAAALTLRVWLPLMSYGFGAETAVICFSAAVILAITGLNLWERP